MQTITMTDYKGNEIKPGMQVCAVRIIDRHSMIFGFLWVDVYGNSHQEMEDKRPDRPCWQPGEYYTVNNSLCIEKTVSDEDGSATFIWPVDFWATNIDKECYVIAIKGISDTNPNE